MLLFEPPFGMEANLTNANHGGISDVELLEFLVGYNNSSNNNSSNTCQQHQEPMFHQPWRSHQQHQTYQSPVHIRIPAEEQTTSPASKRRLIMSEGMVERWEPGEVKSEAEEMKAGSPAPSISSTSSISEASSHAKSTPPSVSRRRSNGEDYWA